MTLEQILDGGYAVASDDWMNMTVVWNGSATYNVWAHVEGNAYRNVECFTRKTNNAYHAKIVARKWIANVYDEMSGYFNQEAA